MTEQSAHKRQSIDWLLIGTYLVLILIGWLNIYASIHSSGPDSILDWESRAGNLWAVAPGMVIGGDRFGNYEKLLPTAKGRKYYECDVDYEGGFRNGKRIVFSSDGLIYLTLDHYESYTLLYDGWYNEDAKYVPAK